VDGEAERDRLGRQQARQRRSSAFDEKPDHRIDLPDPARQEGQRGQHVQQLKVQELPEQVQHRGTAARDIADYFPRICR